MFSTSLRLHLGCACVTCVRVYLFRLAIPIRAGVCVRVWHGNSGRGLDFIDTLFTFKAYCGGDVTCIVILFICLTTVLHFVVFPP